MEDGSLHLGTTPTDGSFDRVHAILVTADERVLLCYKNGEAGIAGGRIEDADTNLEATLKRELAEEINCKIDRCDYLGYLAVEKKEYYDYIGKEVADTDGYLYWARVVARLSSIGEPEADPDRENNWVYGRILAPVAIAKAELLKNSLSEKTQIGELLDYAISVAQERNYFTEAPNSKYEALNAETKGGKEIAKYVCRG